ncbi:hypothetical protein HOG17_04780 [Candidatus Peregrinibacteria bacterium]|jgi:hypothetical protein|nr:hypothetical protein [Candidatus Peregrinibacteria bacterium]MBT4147880.1 hypothetical protein [Candidatus Peregrinibacteria bacterium]MBT4455846.1 hypothetical protein [Candidatus Peregrinibacteria bacterium]
MKKDPSSTYLKYGLLVLVSVLIISVIYYVFFFNTAKEYRIATSACYSASQDYIEGINISGEDIGYTYTGESFFSKKHDKCFLIVKSMTYLPDFGFVESYSLRDLYSSVSIATYNEITAGSCERYEKKACTREEFDKIVDSYR